MYNSHRFHLMPNMDHIFKDKKEADKVIVTRKKQLKISEEERLHRAIQGGTITDKDVQTIVKNGGELKMELERISDRKRNELRHHEISNYGKDFDGVDRDGNWYKDLSINEFFRGER